MGFFRNLYKSWSNLGVYGHSRIISLIIQFFFHLIVQCFTIFHYLLDLIPIINNNEKKISVQLRGVETFLFLIKFFIPTHWKGPSFDCIFLPIFNRITNYGLGAAVTIPRLTNISKQTLYATNFIVSIGEILKNKYSIQLGKEGDDKNKDYKTFYPRNVDILWISAPTIKEEDNNNNNNNNIIIYLHGGGYSLGGPSHIGYASRLSYYTKTKICFINYCKPPTSTIPYQVDQILTVYFYLLFNKSVHNISNTNCILMGDSAGGGLCTLFIQKLSLLNLNCLHPKGIILSSPWIDLMMTSNSWIQCQYKDLIVSHGYVSRSGLIAVGNNEMNLRSQFFSAIYSDNFNINSNILLFVSKHECLYDDSQKLYQKIQNKRRNNKDHQQYDLIYIVKEHLPHAFVIFHGLFPEANDAMDIIQSTLTKWSIDHEI